MQNVAADLAQMLGVERVLWEQEHLLTYGFDGTAALYGEAGCVALPKTTEEVSQVVRYAAKYRIPVVTRGSGTGLSGGSVPVPGFIVLCLVQMDRVLELDPKNLTIHVESGVVTQKVAELADDAGPLYPPDPGSMPKILQQLQQIFRKWPLEGLFEPLGFSRAPSPVDRLVDLISEEICWRS
jgi:glycolate oxidase